MPIRLSRARKAHIVAGCLSIIATTVLLSALLREFLSPIAADACIYDYLREPSMPGARALAAWRASFRGVALNISEDGPITVYERGATIGRIG